MRITLIHNPTSGDAGHSASALQRILRDEGCVVSYRSTDKDWKKALERPGDLVVAAGGDGTIAQVARQMAHRDTPLTVMPLGTANNIAKTLGIAGDAREFVRSWRGSAPRPFDLGVVMPGAQAEPFVEAFGGGIFGEVIASGATVAEATIMGRETDRALHLLRSVAEAARPARWRVEVDGRDLSGDYLAVEVMNIRFAGPNVPLARGADPGDGCLDVILIGPSERDALVAYASERIRESDGQLSDMPRHQGRRVVLRPPRGVPLHLDDGLWTDDDKTGHGTIEIEADTAALAVIRPHGSEGREAS
ncbi:MAG: hypothetical protein M3432_00135 [Chloroflexota bacterium]|nr:hypothetical protein [Chloroflexota bacterium]